MPRDYLFVGYLFVFWKEFKFVYNKSKFTRFAHTYKELQVVFFSGEYLKIHFVSVLRFFLNLSAR
jgi:hypothetical protein